MLEKSISIIYCDVAKRRRMIPFATYGRCILDIWKEWDGHHTKFIAVVFLYKHATIYSWLYNNNYNSWPYLNTNDNE